MTDRLAITGWGLIGCLGAGADACWERLVAGQTGIGPLTAFDATGASVQQAGQAPDLDGPPPADPGDRAARYLEAVCAEALAQAGIGDVVADPERSVLIVGSSLAASASRPAFWDRYLADGPAAADYARLHSYDVEPLLARLSEAVDVRGEALLVSTACAAGASAVALAADRLHAGAADLALVCGADPLDVHTFAGFGVLKALAAGPMRPLATKRDGMALADGFAALVLERPEAAREAGRQPLAWLAGCGESSDAYHRTQPDPRGRGAALAMRRALAMAGLAAADVDHVNLHATATPANDGAELCALVEVFGERLPGIPLVASKPATGHTLGAAGAVEAILALLALRHQRLPPTLGVDLAGLMPEAAALDLVRAPRAAALRRVMSNSFGFGGCNASLLFEASDAS